MSSHVSRLSSNLDASQLTPITKIRCKRSYKLSLSLVLFSLPAATPAFTQSYSAATQCGPFNVTLEGLNLPMVLSPPVYLLPFDDLAIISPLSYSSYNATTDTREYTLDKLPLKSGSQFIVFMDGNGALFSRPIYIYSSKPSHHCSGSFFLKAGLEPEIVSLIQTVGNSSDTSCLPADESSTSSCFRLDSAVPSQCSNQTVSWDSTLYKEPPYVRALIPGGQAFDPRLTPISATVRAWDINIREGTQMLLFVQQAFLNQRGSGSRTSPLITVTGKSSQGDACLDGNSPSSTVTVAPTTAADTINIAASTITIAASTITITAPVTTVPQATNPAQNVK